MSGGELGFGLVLALAWLVVDEVQVSNVKCQ